MAGWVLPGATDEREASRSTGRGPLEVSGWLDVVAEDDIASNHPSDECISITPPRLTPAIIKPRHCFNSAPFGDQ